MVSSNLQVAYFTMEIGLNSQMPTYAGGLGMLAADIMRSCADLDVPAAGMTIAWQHGYMRQELNPDGTQNYNNVEWNPADYLEKLSQTITVEIEGRQVQVGCWQYLIESESGSKVPIYFLDTNLAENAEADRHITSQLYGGDGAMRLKQEVVLGIGGVRMLRALGYEEVGTFHMNEGHAAFLTLELLCERDFSDDAVRLNCAFTTHTPVKAGHDVFDYDLAGRVVGEMLPWHIRDLAGQDQLSMSELAINLSRYTCGVSRIHSEVSHKMFPGHEIDYITNGVHHLTWVSEEMAVLFDQYCQGWRKEPVILTKQVRSIPDQELWKAHQAGKQRLIDEVNKQSDLKFDPNYLTLASARRVVAYKRPELIYQNLERLREVACGKLQIIHAGNAHPSDQFAQDVIKRMVERSSQLKDCVRIAYLENYNPDLAKLMVRGTDIWLNTPMRLYEASGTSGMKACLNGVLNVSTLDGWWIEGFEQDSEAGWRIGPLARVVEAEDHRKLDAEDIYTALQYEVIPQYYYKDRVRWIRRMKRAIALMGYFNTHRCVREYLEKAWIN